MNRKLTPQERAKIRKDQAMASGHYTISGNARRRKPAPVTLPKLRWEDDDGDGIVERRSTELG